MGGANHSGTMNDVIRFVSPGHASRRKCALAAVCSVMALFAAALFAQGTAHVSGIEPATGKVSDSATVKGENLGKGSVTAVFLSDDKADFKATKVESFEVLAGE